MLQYDKNKIEIHGCEQLMNISDTQIEIKCKSEIFIVYGNELKILEFGQQQIIIIGIINSIGILYA